MKHQHQEMQTKDKPGHPFMMLITLRSCFNCVGSNIEKSLVANLFDAH